jgi:pyrroloquinoline quinone biosynthesis protein D
MSAPIRIAPASVPRLGQGIKLRFDETRKAWIILAPERVLMPDDIAVDILQRCDGIATVAAIATALADKYDAAHDGVEQDVIEMLQDLADKGVLVA